MGGTGVADLRVLLVERGGPFRLAGGRWLGRSLPAVGPASEGVFSPVRVLRRELVLLARRILLEKLLLGHEGSGGSRVLREAWLVGLLGLRGGLGRLGAVGWLSLLASRHAELSELVEGVLRVAPAPRIGCECFLELVIRVEDDLLGGRRAGVCGR